MKVLVSGESEPRAIESGPALTPARMVKAAKHLTADWSYGAISIGYPGFMVHERIAAEPYNLDRGWAGFDFGKAFGKPVKPVADAAMQALGSYEGGRMLFLGLGAGTDRLLAPELAAAEALLGSSVMADALGAVGVTISRPIDDSSVTAMR